MRLNFYINTLSYIVVSQKFKLKLISAKFLLPMISRNELYKIIYSMLQRMNERYRAWGALKRVLNKRIGDKCEEVSVRRSNCTNSDVRTEAWGMRSAERRKVIVPGISDL